VVSNLRQECTARRIVSVGAVLDDGTTEVVTWLACRLVELHAVADRAILVVVVCTEPTHVVWGAVYTSRGYLGVIQIRSVAEEVYGVAAQIYGRNDKSIIQYM
jgi:hypothetical protein